MFNITRSDIEKICNYSENSKSNGNLPNGVIHYLDFTDSEEYKMMMIRSQRDKKIDAILSEDTVNDNIEYNNDDEFFIPYERVGDDSNLISSLTPHIKSINVSAKKLINMNYLYRDILYKLDTLTNYPMVDNNCDFTTTNDKSLTKFENNSNNVKKILNKIAFLNGRIAVNSRIGPPNTIILGVDVYNIFLHSDYNKFNLSNEGEVVSGKINGWDIIISKIIHPKKVILVRSSLSGRIEQGLNIINNVNDSTYYMTETPGSWNKSINWFSVT